MQMGICSYVVIIVVDVGSAELVVLIHLSDLMYPLH